MNKLVIVGCGRLAEIITNAVVKGMLPDYELVGVYSRTASKAERIANKMRQHGKMCAACHTLKELLELKPDYLVESASPAAMKELALPTLENGNKPLKWTSFAVVNKIRYHICRKLGVKKIKVGHAGIIFMGVLPLSFLSPLIQKAEKLANPLTFLKKRNKLT